VCVGWGGGGGDVYETAITNLQGHLCFTYAHLCIYFKHCFKTVNMISPSITCSWINFSINQSDLRDKFTVYVKFRLRTRVKYLNISVIHLSLPFDFREKLWVGLGLGVGIG